MTHQKAACEDCDRPYSDPGFPDFIIPFWAWERISTLRDDTGLLCPSCICARLHKAGITCEGAFGSGPITSVSWPTMANLRDLENIKLALTGERDNAYSLRLAKVASPSTPSSFSYCMRPELVVADVTRMAVKMTFKEEVDAARADGLKGTRFLRRICERKGMHYLDVLRLLGEMEHGAKLDAMFGHPPKDQQN